MHPLLTDAPQVAANDLVMAKQMADTLHRHYPGHLWAVTCDGAKGVADVRNLALSGRWGFRIILPAIYSASDFDRMVMRAGGEVLERFRQRRCRIDHEALNAEPLNFAGDMKVEA